MTHTVFTHRMPVPLAELVDAYATAAGLTRIATINILLAQMLGAVAIPTPVRETLAATAGAR